MRWSASMVSPYWNALLHRWQWVAWDFICFARFLYELLYSSRFLAFRSGESTRIGRHPPQYEEPRTRVPHFRQGLLKFIVS